MLSYLLHVLRLRRIILDKLITIFKQCSILLVLSLFLLGCENPFNNSKNLNTSEEINLKVLYYSGLSSSGTVPVDETDYQSGDEITILGNSGNLEIDGCTFTGWNTDYFGRGTIFLENDTTTILGTDLNLYAYGVPENETVVFNGNGATTGHMDPQVITEGSSSSLSLNTYTQSNLTFIDWNTNYKGTGTDYEDGGEYTMDSSGVVLYAQWGFSIQFDANGGSGSMEDQLFTLDGDSAQLTTVAFSKSDADFLCWNTEPDGSGTYFEDKATFTPGEDVTENTILYAQWIDQDSSKLIMTWDTTISSGSSSPNMIGLPLTENGTYAFIVDWGDGTSDRIIYSGLPSESKPYHEYESAGQYTTTISGTFIGFGDDEVPELNLYGYGRLKKLIEISSWGDMKLGNDGDYFYCATNLVITATDHLDISDTNNFDDMFTSCDSLKEIPNINEWDVSHVTNMRGMFRNTDIFDQDISEWDVSQVTDMSSMFQGASSFNQDIGKWDVSNVETMRSMFCRAVSFDQDLGLWNVCNVEDMNSMFTDISLSTSNYDSILRGWSQLEELQNDVIFDAGSSQYTSYGEYSRNQLIGKYDWDIRDAGLLE